MSVSDLHSWALHPEPMSAAQNNGEFNLASMVRPARFADTGWPATRNHCPVGAVCGGGLRVNLYHKRLISTGLLRQFDQAPVGITPRR